MFLCSNSSAVGLWLSRLRKKSRISFWTISHHSLFNEFMSHFVAKQVESKVLTLYHYVCSMSALCVIMQSTLLLQFPLFTTQENQNSLCHVKHDPLTATQVKSAESQAMQMPSLHFLPPMPVSWLSQVWQVQMYRQVPPHCPPACYANLTESNLSRIWTQRQPIETMRTG